MNWTEYFLNIAESVKLKSKDRRTQIGAVIVGKDNEIVTTGYNSFPRGINDDVERGGKGGGCNLYVDCGIGGGGGNSDGDNNSYDDSDD